MSTPPRTFWSERPDTPRPMLENLGCKNDASPISRPWSTPLLSPSLSPEPRSEKAQATQPSPVQPKSDEPVLTAHKTTQASSPPHSNSATLFSSPTTQPTKTVYTPTRDPHLPMVYRSPPLLPRLDTSPAAHQWSHNSTRSPRRPEPRRHYPREFYPTPITVTDSVRWPSLPTLGNKPIKPPAESGLDLPQVKSEYCSPSPPALRPSPSPPDFPNRMPAGAPALLPSQGQPTYVHPGPTFPLMRPRLSIHPYAAPVEPRYFSAGGSRGDDSIGRARSFGSPASAISPGGANKGPRKRADDVQLAVLNEAFDRSAYPSTEEREGLARRLGMTSRSVQIWFQNRRRAVKVEQQSAIQRAEADSIAAQARARGLPGPPYLNDGFFGGATEVKSQGTAQPSAHY